MHTVLLLCVGMLQVHRHETTPYHDLFRLLLSKSITCVSQCSQCSVWLAKGNLTGGMVLFSWGSYWHPVGKHLSPLERIKAREKKGGKERGRSRFSEGENSLHTKKQSWVDFFPCSGWGDNAVGRGGGRGGVIGLLVGVVVERVGTVATVVPMVA